MSSDTCWTTGRRIIVQCRGPPVKEVQHYYEIQSEHTYTHTHNIAYCVHNHNNNITSRQECVQYDLTADSKNHAHIWPFVFEPFYWCFFIMFYIILSRNNGFRGLTTLSPSFSHPLAFNPEISIRSRIYKPLAAPYFYPLISRRDSFSLSLSFSCYIYVYVYHDKT